MVFTVGPKIAKVTGPLSTGRLACALALLHPKPCSCQFPLGRLQVIVSQVTFQQTEFELVAPPKLISFLSRTWPPPSLRGGI